MKAQLETELSESKKNDTPLLAKITRTSRQSENLFLCSSICQCFKVLFRSRLKLIFDLILIKPSKGKYNLKEEIIRIM